MASIERTAYPRFRHEPTARELQDSFTPTDEEVTFGRSLVRGDEHFFAAIVLLKGVQYLGYFPELAEVPASIVNHIRVCLRLSPHLMPAYDQLRTMRRHQAAIREYLHLKPIYSRETRKIAVRGVYESAQVMDNPADLINVAVEQLRLQRCELQTFPALDRMVTRVRHVVHRRVFAQVMAKLNTPGFRTSGSTHRKPRKWSSGIVLSGDQGVAEEAVPYSPGCVAGSPNVVGVARRSGRSTGEVPPALLQHFATEAKALHAGELREVQPPKKYTLVLCLIYRMRVPNT